MYGREALERTTLKSLGLNSGKAIIRLMYRDPKLLKTQAHVSTPLLPKLASAVDDSLSDRNIQRVPSPTPHCSKTTDTATLSTETVPSTKNRSKPGEKANMDVRVDEVEMDTADDTRLDANAEEEKMDVEDGQIDTRNKRRSQEMDRAAIEETHSVAFNVKDHDTERDESVTGACKKDQEGTYKIEFVRCDCAYVQSRSDDVFTYLTYIISHCS